MGDWNVVSTAPSAAPSAPPSPLAGPWAVVSHSAAPAPSTPAAPKSDDDIIRQYGLDPDTIKKSHLYVPGHLLNVANDTKPLVSIYTGPGASPERIADESALSKQIEGVGEGLYRIPAGLFQLAVHGLNKIGIASDADVQYNDLLEKVHQAAYRQRVEGDPSTLGEIVGGALVPIPGGAAKTVMGAVIKGALTGSAAGLMQPVITDGDYATQKVKQALIGGAAGGATGAVAGGIARAIGWRAAELPEQQAARVGTEGAQTVTDFATAMQNTPFAGAGDVGKAAQSGDRAAQVLQDQMAAAKTPAQIQQASIGLMNWRTRQTASSLYDKVQQAVWSHRGLADVPLDQTEQTISDALNQAQKAKDPDTGLISLLKTVQRNIGAAPAPESAPPKVVTPQILEDLAQSQAGKGYSYLTAEQKATVGALAEKIQPGSTAPVAVPAAEASAPLVDNSYGQIRLFRSDLGERISDLRTGAGKQLLGPSSAATLQAVRNSVDADLRNFTASSAPEVQKAADAADSYYARNRVPFMASDIAKAGAPNLAGTTTDAEADQIYGRFIQAGNGDKAQRFYNALDARGQAAVRYQLAADAMNQATDPLRGTFDAGKFFSALDKTKEAHGVFFSGQGKAEMDGLKALARQSVQGSDAEAARIAKLNTVALGSSALAAGAGAAGLHPVAEGLAGVAGLAGAARALMLTDTGRRLLSDASQLGPGDPALARIFDAVSSQLPAAIARTATQP